MADVTASGGNVLIQNQPKGQIHMLGEQRGSAVLVLVLILVAMVLAVSATLPGAFRETQAQSLRLRVNAQVQMMQSSLIAYINNPVIWKQTQAYAGNGTLGKCFADAATNCVNVATPIVIVDRDGTPFYDSTKPGTGFDQLGNLCSTWSMNATGACVYRYEITWTPQCPSFGSKCSLPPILIAFTLRIASVAQAQQFNPARFTYAMRLN